MRAEPDHRADRAAGEHELVARDHDVRQVAALPAHRFRIAEAGDPGGRRGLVELDRELLVLFPLRAVRRDVRLREPPRGGADRRVVLGLEQVRHRAREHTGAVVRTGMQSPAVPARLRRSDHLSWFAHMGAVYLFHDLYGYLMEMSPDIAELIAAFEGGADTAATIEAFRARFADADPRQFVDVLAAHAVLVDPAETELDGMWAFVPIKARWNVWQRRDDRLTLWTAWGDRPVQQLFLDPEETRTTLEHRHGTMGRLAE